MVEKNISEQFFTITSVSDTCIEDMANSYLKKYKTPELACKAMLKTNVIKYAVLNVTDSFYIDKAPLLDSAFTSNILVQMVKCSAYMAGHILNEDETLTLLSALSAGDTAFKRVIKQPLYRLVVSFYKKEINKIDGKTLIKINQKIGSRFITKSGHTGAINLMQLAPYIGGAFVSLINLIEAATIASYAYNIFFKNDYEIIKNNKTISKTYMQSLMVNPV